MTQLLLEGDVAEVLEKNEPVCEVFYVDRRDRQALGLEKLGDFEKRQPLTVGLFAAFVALERIVGELHDDDSRRAAGGSSLGAHSEVAPCRSISAQLDDLSRGEGLAIQIREGTIEVRLLHWRAERTSVGRVCEERYLPFQGMTELGAIGLGTTLASRYELVAEVARGAMGDVFEAFDRVEETKVAVKVLRAEYLADESVRRRFRREGAVLKALDHPAIVRLLELGVDHQGVVFLVTEYVEGETLAERLSKGPLGIGDVDALVDAVCDGLEAAHRHGVLHGDLKPANVVWPEEGGPRLVDFGASKILGLDRLTATGEVSGTPAYMAPTGAHPHHAVDRQ